MLLLVACGGPRGGALSPETRTELDLFSSRDVEIQKKYLFMAEVTAQLLSEAAAQGSDSVAHDMIVKFKEDNRTALHQIAQEFDGWYRYVHHADLMLFLRLLNQQPYAKTLRDIAPAFRRRFSNNRAYLADLEELLGYLEMKR